MSDEKKFEAFKRGVLEDYAKTYETESRAKYGDTEVDEMLVRVQGVTREQYQEWEELGQEILEKLSAAVSAGDDPAGEAGKEIVDLHRRWLTVMGDRYDLQRHRGLAELYVQDERFTAYYDRERPVCPVSPGCGDPLGNVRMRARKQFRALSAWIWKNP